MSANDTVLLLANGMAGNPEITEQGPGYAAFLSALTAIGTELAQAIVRDGEGVTKFVTIHVHGAASDAEAHQRGQHNCHQPPGQDCILRIGRQLGTNPGCGRACRHHRGPHQGHALRHRR